MENEYRSQIKHEYLDGDLFDMSRASLDHRRIATNILMALRTQLAGSSCEAQPEGIRVRTADSRMYSYPDIVVFCGGPKLDRKLGDTLLNPMAIFEVLSPSTEIYDRGKKFVKYRSIATLQEYVLVSQESVFVERYVRQAGGEWVLSSLAGLEETLVLSSIPARLKLSDVYQQVFTRLEGEVK